MAMTAAVKDEISRLPVTRTCCRKAEVSAILRFAGGLHLVSGRIVIEAELDTAMAARRLKRDILEIFGHSSELIVMAPGGLRRGSRYVVRVVAGGDQLARQTGLVDGRGRPIRGLPPQVVSGATCGRLPRARLPHRARPLVLPGGDLPRSRGRARPGGRRPPAAHRRQGA
jgi:DNA-binding protein WhiA